MTSEPNEAAAPPDPLIELLRHHPEAAFDYLEFRDAVAGAAAYHAARRATDRDRQAIAACLRRMEEAHDKTDPTEEAEADADFHLATYEATHNAVMLHVMHTLSDLLRQDVFFSRRTLYDHKGVRHLLLNQHRAIAEAILAGDAERAREAAIQHIRFTGRALAEVGKAEARLEASLRRVRRSDLVAAPRRREREG